MKRPACRFIEFRFSMKYPGTLLLLVTLVLTGCHKKDAPPPSAAAPPPEDNSAAANPAAPDGSIPPAPAPAAVVANPVKPLPPPPKYVTANADNTIRQRIDGEVDANMTGLLRAFIAQNGRMPQSFYEFTLKGMDSIPRPPEGKHWVIDAADVQVKAVPAK